MRWPPAGRAAGCSRPRAGTVFGAHGMGQDTILRNLALLNVLWDGGEMAIDRRSKPSFVLRGRRLTFGLMVQPEALRGFLERAGTLPPGTPGDAAGGAVRGAHSRIARATACDQ